MRLGVPGVVVSWREGLTNPPEGVCAGVRPRREKLGISRAHQVEEFCESGGQVYTVKEKTFEPGAAPLLPQLVTRGARQGNLGARRPQNLNCYGLAAGGRSRTRAGPPCPMPRPDERHLCLQCGHGRRRDSLSCTDASLSSASKSLPPRHRWWTTKCWPNAWCSWATRSWHWPVLSRHSGGRSPSELPCVVTSACRCLGFPNWVEGRMEELA